MSCKAAGLIPDAVSAFAMAGQMCADFVRSAGRQAYRLLEEIFADVGESGVNLNRPAMQRLLASVRSGRADVVVVHRPAVHEPIVSQLPFPIHREQNAPAANAKLSNSGPLGEGARTG